MHFYREKREINAKDAKEDNEDKNWRRNSKNLNVKTNFVGIFSVFRVDFASFAIKMY
jgi:hypothetical protein